VRHGDIFAVIVDGALLAAPAPAGELHQVLKALSDKSWTHPISGLAVPFSDATIERWYYAARQGADPIAALRPKRRHDAGRARRLSPALQTALHRQYRDHPSGSYPLHYDDLAVVVQQNPQPGAPPSYATLRRAFRQQVQRTQRRSDGTLTVLGRRFDPDQLSDRQLRQLIQPYCVNQPPSTARLCPVTISEAGPAR
jgi:hypothetical protein